jgi:hypothetical protein
MKTLSRLLVLAALATAFALPAFAQDPAASPVALCDEAAKADLYTQYYNLKKTNQAADQAKAYEITKQYLDKYGSCTDQYTKALKTWADKYAAALGSVNRRSDFFNAYNANDMAKLSSLGNQLLSADPNDAAVALLAGWGIYTGTTKKTPGASEADALNFVNKALALIEGGQEPKDLSDKVSWAPFASKDEAVSYLNFAIAALELKTNTDDAAKRLVQLAQGNTKLKEEPYVYSFLAFADEQEAAPMLAKYKDVTKNFTVETDESKLLLANINQVIDRTIDAYARAVAYSTKPSDKADFMKRLTELYKSRHDNAVTGLDEMIAGIKSQPLLITQPITSLPATPAAGDGTASATPAATTVAAPASTAPKPVATPTTTAPKPATTTTTPATPVKKKP